MDRQHMGFGEKMKANRFASTMVILATLSLGILIGTVVSGGVKGKEKTASSSDATPLQVPSPQQLSSQFSQIARQLEPAVVNISTESTIKNPHRRGGRATPGTPDDNDGSGDDNPMQDFFDRFFGGQGGQGGKDRCRALPAAKTCASVRWARASSSMPRATSLPTLTSWRRPTAFASS